MVKGTPCRRCGVRIGFVIMADSGKSMPVDPIPDPRGSVVAAGTELGSWIGGRIVPADQETSEGMTRFMSHHGTCARPEDRTAPAPAVAEPWPPVNDRLF